MLHIETINDFRKFLELKSIWNKLLSQSDVDFPFLTFEWLSSWWQSYGKQSEMIILLVKDGSEIVGIAPLMITKITHRHIPIRAITLIANYHSNKSGFIIVKRKEEVVDCVLEYLRKYRFDMLYFDLVEKKSDVDIALEEILNKNKAKYIRLDSTSSPYIPIDSNWDDFATGKSKNFRKLIRQLNNSFNRLDKYELVEYTDKDILVAMNQIFEISKHTWKYAKKTALVSSYENISFYKSLADIASLNKWLHILILKVDGMPAAFHYALIYNGKMYGLKIGYNEKYAALSPGSFLSYLSIKWCFENKEIKEYDFLGDRNPYKLQWTSLTRDHYKYRVFNENLCGRAIYLLESKIISNIKRDRFKKC